MRNDSSFIELKARQRAQALLDDGSYRELLDPFEGIISPWLGPQGIVPQADDGMVVAKGTINGQPAVVVAIEGAFQGGSMGEVSGAMPISMPRLLTCAGIPRWSGLLPGPWAASAGCPSRRRCAAT
ncbi:MAG: malonate decarboxylase, beta subunit [Enterobacter mori]|nr:malonate decarboxylase, beta subunit [Enterobacter mori]